VQFAPPSVALGDLRSFRLRRNGCFCGKYERQAISATEIIKSPRVEYFRNVGQARDEENFRKLRPGHRVKLFPIVLVVNYYAK
jgi:hypothetical protein